MTEQPTIAESKRRIRVRADVERSHVERMPAPFYLRCGAMLIDYTLFIAVIAFGTLLARAFSGAYWAGTTILTFCYFLAVGLAALNLVVLAGISGRTLGKWVTGLRIEKKDGTPPSFGRAALRHLVGYPLSLLTFGLGFLIAAVTNEGRALHDLIAGTIVVRSRKRVRRSLG